MMYLTNADTKTKSFYIKNEAEAHALIGDVFATFDIELPVEMRTPKEQQVLSDLCRFLDTERSDDLPEIFIFWGFNQSTVFVVSRAQSFRSEV